MTKVTKVTLIPTSSGRSIIVEGEGFEPYGYAIWGYEDPLTVVLEELGDVDHNQFASTGTELARIEEAGEEAVVIYQA